MKNYIIKIYVSLMYPVYRIIYPFPKIASNQDTIDYILNTRKSVARFGDAELHIISQTEDSGFQHIDRALSRRLQEVLKSNTEKCMICLPVGFSTVKEFGREGRDFWKHFTVFHYRRYIPYLDFKRIYYCANITRPYMDYKDKSQASVFFECIKELWKGKNVLIVEGSMTRLGMGNDLFDNTESIHRIITLSKQAFTLYDRILEEVSAVATQYDLILIALGASATVLAYDLSKLDVQAVDIGHIDIEYEWFLKGAVHKVEIKGKHVNEVSVELTEEETQDKLYHAQIIKSIF
ncbi:GT-D fold domain-containing glycosyltransferase [Sphingobacterium spiritivorum]|uniref:GT-D fold domain-containing glycosyltransferase n=1 Tax=Sphingobacterium spiritivorum TaxID=258 RepID=UPI003DA32569